MSDEELKSCTFLTTTFKKRKVMEKQKEWAFSPETESTLLHHLRGSSSAGEILQNVHEKLLQSQIQCKLSSYKYQDMMKHKWDPDYFITLTQTLDLLAKSELKCHYCQRICRLLYENVRDPQQWSLDRIDNGKGHNEDNVCLSCLGCNLKRRVTHHQNFLYTQQVVLCKLGATES